MLIELSDATVKVLEEIIGQTSISLASPTIATVAAAMTEITAAIAHARASSPGVPDGDAG